MGPSPIWGGVGWGPIVGWLAFGPSMIPLFVLSIAQFVICPHLQNSGAEHLRLEILAMVLQWWHTGWKCLCVSLLSVFQWVLVSAVHVLPPPPPHTPHPAQKANTEGATKQPLFMARRVTTIVAFWQKAHTHVHPEVPPAYSFSPDGTHTRP